MGKMEKKPGEYRHNLTVWWRDTDMKLRGGTSSLKQMLVCSTEDYLNLYTINHVDVRQLSPRNKIKSAVVQV